MPDETNETLSEQTKEDQTSNDQVENDQVEIDQTSSVPDREKAKEALKSISPPAGRRKRRHYTEEDILLRFTSCGRCGLFLTTYRLSHNEDFLEAIEEIEADWLTLPWHSDMRELVNKSYGSPVDVHSYFLEGTCLECQRSFSYAEPDPDLPAWFLVKL